MQHFRDNSCNIWFSVNTCVRAWCVSTFPAAGAAASIAAFRAWILSLPIRGTRTIRLYVSSKSLLGWNWLENYFQEFLFAGSTENTSCFYFFFFFLLFVMFFSRFAAQIGKRFSSFVGCLGGERGGIWLFLIKQTLFPEMEGELYARRSVARTSVLPELTRVFQISLYGKL